jgi:hypothetical protein
MMQQPGAETTFSDYLHAVYEFRCRSFTFLKFTLFSVFICTASVQWSVTSAVAAAAVGTSLSQLSASLSLSSLPAAAAAEVVSRHPRVLGGTPKQRSTRA